MDWARILAYITGTVDQELLSRNEYLVTENRILKHQLKGRLLLSDTERATLGEIGHRLGRKALADVANAAKPDTILGWYRRLVARKFDGSKQRRYPGRPRVKRELEELVVRMARENRDWGYDRIVGALGNLGHQLSDETVGNILRRRGIAPAPQRKRTTTWKEFIRSHRAVLAQEFLRLRNPTLHVRSPRQIRTMAHALRVRLWLQADIQPPEIDVCSTPNSGHSAAHAGLPVLTRMRPPANVNDANLPRGPHDAIATARGRR